MAWRRSCFIPPPPPAANNTNGVGGIPASGYCGIASGTISGFTFTNPGAGYPVAPTAGRRTFAVRSESVDRHHGGHDRFQLDAAGAITGVLCTNNGSPIVPPTAITLAIAGAGTGATISRC